MVKLKILLLKAHWEQNFFYMHKIIITVNIPTHLDAIVVT